MKDGFKSITIEPFNGYLDFQGPINPQNSTNNLVLKGDIHLHLSKAIKVKRAAIKFVGSSRVCHKNTLDVVDISTPILPKLKSQLFTSTTNLGPGLVILPWEIEIPNCYPCSVMMKRASISYKVELSISLGLHRSVTAEYPIVIKRHLLPCVEVAPLVPTKLYTKTISTKFHYEIDAPRIVCTAQQSLPIAIKLLTIGTHKPVLSIRTQLIQVELYRCNTLPKTDADMSKFKTQLLGQKTTSSTTSKKGESSKYAKYTKRTSPAIIHTLDETRPISSNQPLLLRHPLGEYLALGLESPLAAVYHQLEITFQFGAKFEEVRAKVPILIASAGPSPLSAHPQIAANGKHQQQKFLPLAVYPFEKISVMEPLFVMDESRLDYHPTASQRIPTPTPSSTSSSDQVTVNDDEVTGYLKIITNHRKQIRENGTASENHNNVIEEKQSLRRTRSADLMIDTPPLDDPSEHRKAPGNKHYLQIPQQPRHQRHFQHTITHSHTKSMHINPMNSIPRHLQENLSSATSRNNNTEMSPGMWPRPDTKVPHQWRRRSSSQPYSSIDSSTSTPPRPAKDPKRFLPYASTGKTPLQYPGGLRTMAAAAAAARALYPLPAESISLEDNSTCSTGSSNHNDFDETSTTESSSSTTTSSTASSSSYVNSSCRSSTSASSSLPYQPQSRPNSPAFSPAPGLPSSTVLRPQNANPVALLEESFVPPSPTSTFSPSYWTDSLTSQQLQHRESLQYTQGFTRSSSNRCNLAKSSDTMSVISTAQSSILDPDEDMIQMMEAMEIQYRQHLEHKRLLEQHYTYAELPPIPSNIPSTSSATASAAISAPALDQLTTMHFGDESSEYSDEGSSGVNDADDDDDSVDGDRTTEATSSTHNNNATSIKSLPYQELPPDDDDPVCLCPKHGVIVARR